MVGVDRAVAGEFAFAVVAVVLGVQRVAGGGDRVLRYPGSDEGVDERGRPAGGVVPGSFGGIGD